MSSATPDKSPPPPGSPADSPFQPAPGQSVFLGVGWDRRAAHRRALIVLAVGLALTGLGVGIGSARRAREQARLTEQTLVERAAGFQNQTQSAAAGVYTAVTWVLQGRGRVDRFLHYSRVLLPAYPGLRVLYLAPEAVVRTLAPPRPLARLRGRNLLHEPAFRGAAAGAVQSRNICFGPPLMVASNTPALPVCAPVFFPRPGGGLRLWGLVGGCLDLKELLRRARLEQLPALGYRYTLGWREANGQTLHSVAGAAQAPAEAAGHEIRLPGLTWRLALWPERPAVTAGGVALACLPGVALSLLAAALVGAVGRARQASEAALKALAERGRAGDRFTALFEAVAEPVLLTKPDGRVVLLNRAAETLLGYPRGELLGRPLATVLPAAGPGEKEGRSAPRIPEGAPLTARCKDGRELPVTVRTGRMEAADDGGPLLCHTLCVPPAETASPAAEAVSPPAEAAPASPEPSSAETLFEASPGAHLLLREDLRIARANAAAARLLGETDPARLARRPLTDFAPATQPDGGETPVLFQRHLEMCERGGFGEFAWVLEFGGDLRPVTARMVYLPDFAGPRWLVLLDPAPDRETTEELAALRRRWRAVVAGLRDWETWMDVDGKPQWIGGPVQSFTGYPAEELLALPDYPLPLVLEADRDAVREVLLSALQGSSGSNFEFRVRRRDGQIRRVVMSWRPVFDERRQPLGYRLTIRAAVQAVAAPPGEAAPEAAAEAEKSDALDLALESAGIGVWDWHLPSGRNVWDERMLRLFALTPEEFGRSRDPWRERLLPEDADRFEAALESAKAGDGAFEVEFRIQLPDGGFRSLACKGRLRRDADGRPERLVGATWDTTALRQVEEALLRQHALLQGLLADTRMLVHVKDAAGRYRFANPAWCERFGVEPDRVAGATDDTLLPPEVAACFAAADRRVAERLEAERRIETLIVDGVPRRFLCERFPLLDGAERLEAVVTLAVELPEDAPPSGDDENNPAPPGPEPQTPPEKSPDPSPADEASPAVRKSGPAPEPPPEPPEAEPSPPSAEAVSAPAETASVEPAPEPELPPPRQSRRKTARKSARKRARRAPAAPSQTLLPGFTTPPAEPDPAAARAPFDPAAVAEQLGIAAEAVPDRLADFVLTQQRALRELREALEEENHPEARALSHGLAEAAGAHGLENLRRLAKTIELALRFGEGNLPAMLAELETEAERLARAVGAEQ